MEQSHTPMNIRWTIGMAVIVSSVAVPGAAGQVPGDASDPVRPYLERGEAYDLFIQALRLEDEGEIVQAVELLARAAELDAEAPAIPAAQAGLYARLDQATNAVEAAERALALDAEYVDAHRVLGLMFAALAEQAAGQSAGQRSANAESYRRRALTHLEQAAAGGVEDARVTFSLGRLLVETGAFDDAVAALEPFVRDRPGFVDGLLLLATAYAGAGRAVEATEALEEAVRGRPRSVRALSALAELYEAEGRWDDAADAYGRAAARRPSDVDLKRRWAAALLNAGDQERARTVIEEVVEARPSDGGAIYLLSEIERRLNNFEAAEAAARQVIALEPDGARGIYALAQVFLDRRQYRELVEVVEPFVRDLRERGSAPRELAMLLVQSGASHLTLGDSEAALAAFELARDAAPDDPIMEAYLGQAYLESGQPEDAVASLSEARERHADDLRLDGMYARALVATGRADQGIGVMETAVARHAENPIAHVNLANLLVETGRVNDAVAALRDAEPNFPADTSILFQLGAILEQQALYADAEQAFRRVIQRDPSHHQALNYLGYMLADRADRLDESVELIQRALESDPHNGAYLDSLGWAYFRLEEWELAETYLRQAAEQMTRDSVIQDHFGDVLFQRGQFTEAVEAWERALAGDVESIELSVIERKIEGARQRGGR